MHATLRLHRLPAPAGPAAEPPLLLISLVIHRAAAPADEALNRQAERLGLPPRQRQLASLLLAGRSLTAAAAAMGISRRTAADHLQGLFTATDTRRQADLLLRLARAAEG